MEITEYIDRNFQAGDEEGEGIVDVLVEMFLDATTDWSHGAYTRELRSFTERLATLTETTTAKAGN